MHAVAGRLLGLVQHFVVLPVLVAQVLELLEIPKVFRTLIRDVGRRPAVFCAWSAEFLVVVVCIYYGSGRVSCPAVPERGPELALVVHRFPEPSTTLKFIHPEVGVLERSRVAVSVRLHEIEGLADILQLIDVGSTMQVFRFVVVVLRPPRTPILVVFHGEVFVGAALGSLDRCLLLGGERVPLLEAPGGCAPHHTMQEIERLLFGEVVKVPEGIGTFLVDLPGFVCRIVGFRVPDVEVLHLVRTLLEVRNPFGRTLHLLPLDLGSVLELNLCLVGADPTLVSLLARLDCRVPLVAISHVPEFFAALGLGIGVRDEPMPLFDILLDTPTDGCRDHTKGVPPGEKPVHCERALDRSAYPRVAGRVV